MSYCSEPLMKSDGLSTKLIPRGVQMPIIITISPVNCFDRPDTVETANSTLCSAISGVRNCMLAVSLSGEIVVPVVFSGRIRAQFAFDIVVNHHVGLK